MFKLKKQLCLLKLVSLIFLGLLILKNNNVLYASPGIDLDARMTQLTEERNNLFQQLTNIFNNLSLDNVTRLSRMHNITTAMEQVSDEITNINRQLILRDQFQRQRRNNTSNQQNNNSRH